EEKEEEKEEENGEEKKRIKDMRPITMLFNIANKNEQLENLLVKRFKTIKHEHRYAEFRNELNFIYNNNEPMIYTFKQDNKSFDVLVKLPGFCKKNNKEVMLWIPIELKTFNKDYLVERSEQFYETLERMMSAHIEKQENGPAPSNNGKQEEPEPSNKGQLSEQEKNNLKKYWIFPGELYNTVESKNQLQKAENQQISIMRDVESWRQKEKKDMSNHRMLFVGVTLKADKTSNKMFLLKNFIDGGLAKFVEILMCATINFQICERNQQRTKQ
ncbi:hypothetical protein RFI_24456, partial [Reticulomyxa filosa]